MLRDSRIQQQVILFKYYPTNPFDDDLDIKIYRSKFNSPTAGINTLSVGFVNVIGVAKNC